MFSIIFPFIGSFFSEVSTSIGKKEVNKKTQCPYTMGFLNLFWATIFLFVYGVFISKNFVFSFASLPTFGARIFFEIIQTYVTIMAITKADRSTFSFLRIWTIPILLAVDIFLGYTIGFLQVIGMIFIVISFIFLFINHGLKKKGMIYVIITAVNAVITISLYKYNITHFNSVEAEQSIICFILLIYLFLTARCIKKENPFKILKTKIGFLQSMLMGIASVFISFAYQFAPASIITTVKRSATVLLSIISGNMYFHEDKFWAKIISFILITIGIVLLAI